ARRIAARDPGEGDGGVFNRIVVVGKYTVYGRRIAQGGSPNRTQVHAQLGVADRGPGISSSHRQVVDGIDDNLEDIREAQVVAGRRQVVVGAAVGEGDGDIGRAEGIGDRCVLQRSGRVRRGVV